MLGSLLPRLFLGVTPIGVGAPSFLIDSSMDGGQGAWLTGLKVWLWSLPSYPTGPGELSPSGFVLQRVSVAHNEAMTPGLSLFWPAYPFACQPGFPNQRLFLSSKHGASSWFLFIYLPFPSPAADCNVETDFHNVYFHRCSDFSFVRHTALVPTSISISILFEDTPFLHFQS